ncbi:N-acetylmuramoyl-L-alanine amidase [Gilliamella sp. ESL0441]|uniref:peptidoglycan recognition protein family protein n=1 Tax=Gilliamella sp. ESL0441 TaxID=2704654 RepID=UPI001C69D764|nr:peptidoglycan recognition family protein [Gilliamella sp. ESL0441]QYN44423.1 N-acetylmuramoyl-L-alanine amidase [Gilliamella sp. ESL0441]
MENESLPTENIKSPNDQSEIVDSYSANPNQIVYDLLHQSDFDINVTDAYFAKKVNAPNKPNEYTYLKLNQARLGDKIYLVVKCYGKPPKGSLVISIREIEKKGNEQNLYPQKSISFLVNGVEKTELQFTIDEKIEYIQEIEIRPKDDEKYQELVDKLNSLENKSTHLTIRTEIKDTNATKVNFKGILTGEFDAVKGARYYDFLNEEKEYFTLYNLSSCFCSKLKIDSEGFISGGKVEKNKIASCNNGSNMTEVKIIVLHRTAGGVAAGTLSHMNTNKYGAHFVIDNAKNTDGTIYHAISIYKKGTHMGRGQYKITKDNNWGNHNSIGIEVCGYSYTSDGKKRVGANGNLPHGYWQEVTEEQAKSLSCLVKFLLEHYNLTIDDVKCHEDLCAKDPNEGKDVYKKMMNYWH